MASAHNNCRLLSLPRSYELTSASMSRIMSLLLITSFAPAVAGIPREPRIHPRPDASFRYGDSSPAAALEAKPKRELDSFACLDLFECRRKQNIRIALSFSRSHFAGLGHLAKHRQD